MFTKKLVPNGTSLCQIDTPKIIVLRDPPDPRLKGVPVVATLCQEFITVGEHKVPHERVPGKPPVYVFTALGKKHIVPTHTVEVQEKFKSHL